MIIRAFLVIVGVCALLFGLYMLRFIGLGALPPIIVGIVLLLGTIFEGRYRPRIHANAGGWQATGERFVDPASGKLVDVFYNPTTGEREYRNVTQ